jgi:hypothetical protein
MGAVSPDPSTARPTKGRGGSSRQVEAFSAWRDHFIFVGMTCVSSAASVVFERQMMADPDPWTA